MTSDFARPEDSLGRLAPGRRIAGYLIEAQIGAGGMAVVFRAHDELLGRPAAVKVIASAMADDAEFRARFLHESRAAAAVDSPHIVPVYSAGEADGLLYIATRFVAGGDLAGLLRRSGGRLAAGRVAEFVSQTASALDAAHAAGLVHRDVKPANILVDSAPGRTEHAYLSDFGLSKGTHSTGLTASGQFLGTPDYCAPEQIRGGHVDGRADQYALGCVAFALLASTPPFRRDDTVATIFAHLNDPVPAVTGLRPELPAAVDSVIARALAKSAADRYSDCGEFAAELHQALDPARHVAAPGRRSWSARDDAAPVPGSAPPGQASARTPVPPGVTDEGTALPPESTGYARTIPRGNNDAGHHQGTPGQHRGHGRGRSRAIWAAGAAVLLAGGVTAALGLHVLSPDLGAASQPPATPSASGDAITARVLAGSKYEFTEASAIVAEGSNIWVGSPAGQPTYSVAEYNASDGNLVRTLSGTKYGFNLSGLGGIAADTSHLWVTNGFGNSVTEFNVSDGSWVRTLSGGSYGFNSPMSIADDGTHVWVVNTGGLNGESVTEFNASDGSWIRTLRGSSHSFGDVYAIVADGSHVWLGGYNSVTELNASDGSVIRTLSSRNYGFNSIEGLVIDHGHAWVTNTNADSVTEFNTSDGSWIQTLSGVHFNQPDGIATDGTHIWVVNHNSLTELNASDGSWVRTLSADSYRFNDPDAVAAEGSHVWVANVDGTAFDGGPVTELTIG